MGTGGDPLADSLIDRGDAQLSDQEIYKLLEIYKAQVDAGVRSIMISHSMLNGVRMHENKKYIDILRNELGFDGVICGDHGLEGNREAIEKVKALGKPTVCCIVAGRNVFIDKYADDWDGEDTVMAEVTFSPDEDW